MGPLCHKGLWAATPAPTFHLFVLGSTFGLRSQLDLGSNLDCAPYSLWTDVFAAQCPFSPLQSEDSKSCMAQDCSQDLTARGKVWAQYLARSDGR